MGQHNYDGRGIARPIAAAAAGLAALVSVSSAVLADDIKPIAYRDTNLAQYGVPNFEGLKPIRTKWLDKSDAIPGNETRFDMYGNGVATYSVAGRVYAVLWDKDGKAPLDYMYVDQGGAGSFEAYPPYDPFVAPSWISELS